ncbi:hypothetical protein MAR_021527 [Mya arenaria]|uniref:Uncharacterized protein n=1 Tax=Mya arenaria TaxID=6604 RepID=A0ABY7EBT1_MYAAR|nr:hypothetical protein MAR_021527 [Mya arenaria]
MANGQQFVIEIDDYDYVEIDLTVAMHAETTVPTTPPKYVDMIRICKTFQRDSFYDFENFTIHNCPKSCGYCPVLKITAQTHNDDGLPYAELDIKFLQEANARVSSRRSNTPTEYADIEFTLTQKSAY